MPAKWSLGMKGIPSLFGKLQRFGEVGMLSGRTGKERKWKIRKSEVS